MVTYSTTLGSQRVVNKESRYKYIYIARFGTQGINPTCSECQVLLTDANAVAAVFHDQIREELIAIANEGGAHGMFPLSF